MDKEELTTYIIKRLGEGDAVNEVIRAVCEKTNLHWSDARRLVFSVQQDGEAVITRKQFPLLTGLALLTFLGGLALAGFGIYSIVSAFFQNQEYPGDITSYLWPAIAKGDDPLTAIEPAILPYLRLILVFLINPFSAILFGGIMVYASLAGMKAVWSALLNRKWKARD
jgi:hypothetical protein